METAIHIIYMVAYVFKGGPSPTPENICDVDCSGLNTSADVIYLVNYIFKGAQPPCSVCRQTISASRVSTISKARATSGFDLRSQELRSTLQRIS